MDTPSIAIAPDDIRTYAKIFGIKVPELEFTTIAEQLSRLCDELIELWEIDVSSHEMAVIFPIQHSQ